MSRMTSSDKSKAYNLFQSIPYYLTFMLLNKLNLFFFSISEVTV